MRVGIRVVLVVAAAQLVCVLLYVRYWLLHGGINLVVSSYLSQSQMATSVAHSSRATVHDGIADADRASETMSPAAASPQSPPPPSPLLPDLAACHTVAFADALGNDIKDFKSKSAVNCCQVQLRAIYQCRRRTHGLILIRFSGVPGVP